MTHIHTFLASLLLFQTAFAAEPPQVALHYQPPGTYFGDPIPFYHDGVHHVFYLHSEDRMHWYHLASRDLVHWDVLPPAILADENDRTIATGSIVESDGLFHAFYTTFPSNENGPGLASVRVATSRDLIKWTKEPGEPLLMLKRDVPAVGTYETAKNWRDPHVFWNRQAKQWWLAIAAHENTSIAYPYAGAVALATSTDLRSWTVQPEPLLATREGPAAECPDVFPFGDGWGLIYYADTTRIRVADSPAGPWRRPGNDPPWGLHFQAGKTEFDGRRRIAHAYIQRADEDFAKHVYGGCMALPRELYLDDKSRVATRLVPEIIAACKSDTTKGRGASVFVPVQGDPVSGDRETITLAAGIGCSAMALWKDAPADVFFSADVTLAADSSLSLLLRGSELGQPTASPAGNPLEDYYALALDAHTNQVTLKRPDVWDRMPALRTQPLDLPTTRSFKLHVMLHGDILEAFVDDRISVTSRVQLPGGAFALLARDGSVSLENVRITKLPQ